MSGEEPKIVEKTYVVTDEDAIHFLGPQVVPALSTPCLINWLELACRENAAALLGVGEDTVGVSVTLRHLAPTPVGMKVRVVSRLTAIEGRSYSFAVEAYDEAEKIAEGTHARASVPVAKFAARIAAKKQEGPEARGPGSPTP